MYQHALSLLNNVAAERVICIGDSIEHDIAGAAGSGLASCLVRTGILAASSDNDLASIIAAHDARPDFLMDSFKA
nr:MULTISPECIES: HAD hydrolase-like protein [unclassified Ensifer]